MTLMAWRLQTTQEDIINDINENICPGTKGKEEQSSITKHKENTRKKKMYCTV